MSNLYTIEVEHAAPKDSHSSIECLAIADSEEQVYENVDRLNGGMWSCAEEDGDTHTIYDEDYNEVGQESEKQRRMRLRGDIDDDHDWSDAYYGLTWYGWNGGIKITEEEIALLLRLGVAVDWR